VKLEDHDVQEKPSSPGLVEVEHHDAIIVHIPGAAPHELEDYLLARLPGAAQMWQGSIEACVITLRGC
jgi:hypothetical protein